MWLLLLLFLSSFPLFDPNSCPKQKRKMRKNDIAMSSFYVFSRTKNVDNVVVAVVVVVVVVVAAVVVVVVAVVVVVIVPDYQLNCLDLA